MIDKEFIELIKKQFELDDTREINEKIKIYKEFLQTENKKYNLTRLDQEDVVYESYFYESIINFKKTLFFENMNLLDIGSGSGIPGIVLKIIFPNINLYIVEANKKKCQFMEQLVAKLALKNVYIFNARCEDFIKQYKNFFDLITCRAVASLRIILELAYPGLKINGIGFFLKSQNYLQELNEAQNIILKLNASQPEIEVLKYLEKTFVSLKFVKTKKTDEIYPRTWKEILNNDKT